MASLKKRVGTKFWVGCFRMPDGRRVQQSTRSTNKSDALQICLAWEKASREKATATQAQRVLSRIVNIVHGERMSVTSIKDYLLGWAEKKKAECADSTAGRYEQTLKSLIAFLGDNASGTLSSLHTSQIAAWRDDLAKRLSVKTTNLYLKSVKGAMGSALADGLITENPARGIKLLRESKSAAAAAASKRRSLRPEEIKKILAVIPKDSEWRGMVLAGLYTGQRLIDIACMRRCDITDGWWRFTARKTGSSLAIPIGGELEDWLASQLKRHKGPEVFPEAAGFVRRAKGKSSTLSNQFHTILVRAGLQSKRTHESIGKGRGAARKAGGISFHYLRHTANSLLKAAGVSESVAMALIGHDSRDVSRLYTHLPEESLQAAARKLQDVLG
jgi:integrase